MGKNKLTHLDEQGDVRMVDITSKSSTFREAIAQGTISMESETLEAILQHKMKKGNVIEVAKIAGILAAKSTSSLIPLCHPLPLTGIEVKLQIVGDSKVEAEAIVKTKAQTGVEMEALIATSTTLLTVWDMTKQYEKDAEGQYPSTSIENLYVVSTFKAKQE